MLLQYTLDKIMRFRLKKKINGDLAVTVTKWLPFSDYLSNALLLPHRAVILFEGTSIKLNELHLS